MNKQTKAKLKNAAAMVIFGSVGLFVKSIKLSSAEIALWRAVIAVVIISGAQLALGKKNERPSRRELLLLFASGAAMGLNWLLLFSAYKYTSVSLSTLAYYCAPIIVLALCPLLLREKLGKKQLACIGASAIGLMLLLGIITGGITDSDLRGILLGLGAAAFYAGVILLNKFIKSVSGISRTLVQLCAAIITLLPAVAKNGFQLAALSTSGIISLLIVGAIHTAFAYILYFSSLADIPASSAALFSYIDPLCAIMLSALVLHETLAPLQLLGGALLLGASLFGELPKRSLKGREK